MRFRTLIITAALAVAPLVVAPSAHAEARTIGVQRIVTTTTDTTTRKPVVRRCGNGVKIKRPWLRCVVKRTLNTGHPNGHPGVVVVP